MRTIDPVRHEEKRREILEAAGRCFVHSGFQGASISQICSEAAISPGHLYHYFASKDAIIAAIAKAHLDEILDRLEQIMASGENVIRAVLLEMSQLHGGRGNVVTPLLLDMLAEAKRNPAVAGILQRYSRTIRGLVAEILIHGQARGEIDAALDPDLAANILLSIVDGIKALSVRNPEIDPTAVDDLFGRLIGRFLAARIRI